MQYVLVKPSKLGRPWALVDGRELDQLQSGVQPELEDKRPGVEMWKVAYGAMRWPPDDEAWKGQTTQSEDLQSIEKFGKLLGLAFCRLTERQTFRLSLVQDIQFFPHLPGLSRHVGLAVLLKTREQIPPDSQPGLTLFPHYDDLDPLTNIINRPALLCLKGEERKARKALAKDQSRWRDFIDAERAIETAYKCT